METYPIFVPILTTNHAHTRRMRQIIPRSRNIDKQATSGIDPSRINNILLVFLIANDIMRIDFEHVISPIGYARRLVMEDRHVVVVCDIMH